METRSKKKQERLSENFEINKDTIQYFNADSDVKVIDQLLKEYAKHFETEFKGAGNAFIISSDEEEIKNLTGNNSDKKIFISNLTKLIMILVSAKNNTVVKM